MLLSLTGAWRNVRSLPEATANGLGTSRHNIETIHAKCRARICQGCYNCVTVGKLVLIAFLGRGKRNLAVVGLALLLSCCTNERETKILLGIPGTVEQTPDSDLARNIFACRQYGFYPGTQQWDECMKYVGSKRPPLLRP